MLRLIITTGARQRDMKRV